MLADLQSRFRAALLDRTQPVPADVGARGAARPERRYAVYRNNVLLSLIEALRARFPAAARIAGEEFFKEMARRFVLSSPPRSPVLSTYGDDLPAFVDAFEPAWQIPYLADVLRLEIAWSQAYHAADAEPARAEALAGLTADALGHTRVAIHPAVRLLRSAYPVVTLWAMNVGAGHVHPIEDWSGEDALVTRPDLAVDVLRLPPGGFDFIAVLRDGAALGDALEAALARAEDFDAARALAGLVSAGVAMDFQS
ncbi:MAG TPA: DNA-binding domain-containing protein [Lichenihabitans sp.]|jgi:hypothetical protein|nr:DNA-binding domain-containing protein [Lichenihabitans sp.]